MCGCVWGVWVWVSVCLCVCVHAQAGVNLCVHVSHFLLVFAGSVFAVGAFNTIRLCDRTGVSSSSVAMPWCQYPHCIIL